LDAGVDIVARPPGRELLSIGLLSGGQRTLTALALLFAVFEARPSPFCILDEVDAALDDANIERFLAMLDGFRKTTQFVVVTHNKGTMAACDSLYGVTMETKGVSRQVSVELAEADRWTSGAEAAAPKVRALDRETGLPVHDLVPARSGARAEAPRAAEESAAPVEAL
jgi:chromosome segregation protein